MIYSKEETKMAQKVTKVGIKREEGWLYFIDKEGDISRVKMARGGQKKKKTAKKAVKKAVAKKAPVKKVVKKKK
jgi:hypothetical protein